MVLYQRVGIRKNEGEGFTTGRDPTGGVFEVQLFFKRKTSFQISYIFQQRYIYISFLKENAFIIERLPLEPPTILACINPPNN